MLPNSLITRTYLARALQLWIGARLFATAALAFASARLTELGMAAPRRHPLALTVGTLVLVLAATVLLGFADVRRRHERAFLENVGVSRQLLVALFAGAALAAELCVAAAIATFASP